MLCFVLQCVPEHTSSSLFAFLLHCTARCLALSLSSQHVVSNMTVSEDDKNAAAVHAQRVVRGFLGRLAGEACECSGVQTCCRILLAARASPQERQPRAFSFGSAASKLSSCLSLGVSSACTQNLHTCFSSTSAGELGVRKDLRSEDPRVLLLQHLHLRNDMAGETQQLKQSDLLMLPLHDF